MNNFLRETKKKIKMMPEYKALGYLRGAALIDPTGKLSRELLQLRRTLRRNN